MKKNKKKNKKKITIKETAELLEKSEMFVRIGIQQKSLPFGVAIKLPGRKKFSYHIPRNAVYEYLKMEGVQNEK